VIGRFGLVVAMSVCASGALAQQQSRAELLRTATTAYDDFAPDRALDLLRAAVNPALGPTDTAWTRGVHLLTQILVEGNKPDLARTWARWAMRTAPGMSIDTVNFLAGVAAALREAKTFTGTRTPGDGLTQTTWRWPARTSTEPNGLIAINQGTMTATVNARVVGGGLIPAGSGISLPPGTYEIEAAAVGYLPARVTREVLPGVTTVLTLSLTSVTVANEDISDNARQHTFANVVPLTIQRFGAPPACALGAFVSRDGLILTSYQAIRGADSIAVGMPGAPRVTIAAHDVAADVAILRVSSTRTDSIPLATSVADGQSLWAVRLADCRTPSDTRVRLTRWTDRPAGAMQLADALSGMPAGAAIVDREGRLAGIWTGGTSAVPSPKAAALLELARRNASPTSVADASRRENHLYGSIAIAANLNGASIGVTPLETWHWEGLAATGPATLTFIGPMGRYRVKATTPDGATREQEITLRPGAHQRLVISMRAVATAAGPETTSTVAPKKRSKLPWIIAGVGGVGVAAAVALGGGGGGGGGGPGPGGGNPAPGSITIQIPVNP
jgi:hypothetical protein